MTRRACNLPSISLSFDTVRFLDSQPLAPDPEWNLGTNSGSQNCTAGSVWGILKNIDSWAPSHGDYSENGPRVGAKY